MHHKKNSLKGNIFYRLARKFIKSLVGQFIILCIFIIILFKLGIIDTALNRINVKKDVEIPAFAQILEVNIPCLKQFSSKTGYTTGTLEKVRVTAYANRVEETDDTPNLGACDRQVYVGSIAVSQDLFKKKLHCGDTVCLTNNKKCYIVEDTMNARFKNSMDIFTYSKKKAQTTLFHSNAVYFKVKI